MIRMLIKLTFITIIISLYSISIMSLSVDELNSMTEEEICNFVKGNIENSDRNYTIHDAASHGCIEHLKSFINNGISLDIINTEGDTPLSKAVWGGKYQAVELLLKNGANPNIANSLEHNMAPLHLSMNISKIDIANILIFYGADVNAVDDYSGTPLVFAVIENDIEKVVLLLKSGAYINGMNDLEPIFFVKSIPILNILLEHGANLHSISRGGDTVLFMPSQFGEADLVQKLIELGIDVNHQNNDGVTALMCAAGIGKMDHVKIFINAGADPSIKDKEGKTALDYAKEKGYQEIVEYLESLTQK